MLDSATGQTPMQNYTPSDILRIGGIFTIAFSVITGLLVAFVLPTACSIVGGLGLVFLGFLLFIGLLAFASGLILQRRNRKFMS